MSWSLSLCIVCVLGGVAFAGDLVPFVIPARVNSNSPIAVASAEAIHPDSERLVARGGHFYRGGERVRLWGVNLSFGANMPRHEDARHIAARLAAAGVNAVRCHHMDTARWPRGIWDSETGKKLSPEALDRLDFFIDQLARRGIWVNINLHVGKEHSRAIGLHGTNRNYDKISNIFTPALIEAQKKYARDLLGHVNSYRNARYADDSAVAIVEITNENSFFMWGAEETLRTLPKYYADILQGKFNAWLKHRCGTSEKLRSDWSDGAESIGANMLENGDFRRRQVGGTVPLRWNLEQHGDCRAWCSRQRLESRRALIIDIEQADDVEWHLQLNQGGLAVKKGRYYTVIFESAGNDRSITCSVSQAGSPWRNLGLSQRIELTKKRTTYRFGFVANADEDNARLSIAFGGSSESLYLANVEFRPGGRVALMEGESLDQGNVRLFCETESPSREVDRMRFLAETEKGYFDDMRGFIREALGCKALVTGTIVFGPLGLYAQSDMDFIDGHAYWQHPRFPNRPWDRSDWLIEQKAMTDYPEQSPLFRLAAQRLKGKPYTVSEYNHPAPLDSQAECVPMLASFAAAQDWDGLWLYTYSHASDDWDREILSSYFDIDTNPAKWGFMRAGTAIFRETVAEAAKGTMLVGLADVSDVVGSLAKLHIECDRDMFEAFAKRGGMTRDRVLTSPIAATFDNGPFSGIVHVSEPKLTWSVEDGDGIYTASGRTALVYIGHAERFEKASAGRISITGPEFSTVTVTALDGEALDRSRAILITACGRCENTGMKFSEDRRTVGREWGEAPVRIEPVEGTLVLPQGRWTCNALGPDAMPKSEAPVSYRDGKSVLELSPKYETMWYLARRRGD